MGEKADARVVHHDIEAPEGGDGLIDGCGHLEGIGNVRPKRLRRSPGGADETNRFRRAGFVGAVVHGERHAAGRQTLRDRPADALGCAGDERDLPIGLQARDSPIFSQYRSVSHILATLASW
jgi:hypothetical protein